MTVAAAARRHKLSWHVVTALAHDWSELVAEHRRNRRCRVLLVDETSMPRRHRYVTVIVNADTGRTLAMVPHRSAAALSGFFIAQGRSWCRGVRVVVTDGSKSYKAAIDARLGHARCVLDRFHVIRWFSAGLTQVRRDVQRREPPGVKPVFDPDAFRARFALQRREDNNGRHPAAVRRYDRDVDQPVPSGSIGDIRPEPTLADRPAVPREEDLDAASARRLRSLHPERDWSDPEGALETLALLNDPEAMADLAEADNNIANDDLLPLDRYAPPL